MQPVTPISGLDDAELSVVDPVFVLCHARSGSTLLRFLLDAHQDLACPPETNLSALCAQLATVWSMIEGAPLSANRGDEPPAIPDAAIAGTRETMDRIVGRYLQRRGKLRYCDKSLGTARYAELITRVYPAAKFLCLYRHPMDVIASGLEACPFGLTGYGFDSYNATTPGNAVLALARYWVDNTAATLAVEERFGDRCLRVRYEDLVTDPEGTAARIFTFLDADQVPAISSLCFSEERERSGPADYKIWYTSEVSTDSIGRGWSIPIAMIAPQVLATINELADKLGFLSIDGTWGTSAPPKDMRVTDGDPPSDAHVPTPDGQTNVAERRVGASSEPMNSKALSIRLRDGLAGLTPMDIENWGPSVADAFSVIWVPRDPTESTARWLVDLRGRTVSFISHDQDDSGWDVIGSADAWDQVTGGRVNLSVALRSCQIRYCDGDDPGPLATEARLRILAYLLGLGTWGRGPIDAQAG